MVRALHFLYALVSYGLFLLVFLYLIAFTNDLWVPTTVNQGLFQASPAAAGAACVGLLALFGVQHSVMARRGFKEWLTRRVPRHLERSTYVLVSNVVMVALLAFWAPIPVTLYQVTAPGAVLALHAVSIAGFLLVVLASFHIDHFDLFGLRQAYLHLRGREYTDRPFRVPGLYKHVRHPLYVGWILGVWVTPHITVSHLLLAAGMTGYILVALVFEERDLVRAFGDVYEGYRQRVPMLLPSLRAAAHAPGQPEHPRVFATV